MFIPEHLDPNRYVFVTGQVLLCFAAFSYRARGNPGQLYWNRANLRMILAASKLRLSHRGNASGRKLPPAPGGMIKYQPSTVFHG